MRKKILVINGHPNKESLNFALANAYQKGAETAGAEVKVILIADLKFNPNLQHGFMKRTELEPDMVAAWDKIKWAEHIVFVHPVWWGGLPAITKGFIDRLFLPGFAFQYKENSVWWDKLLKGKTARIITSLDQPSWYYWVVYGKPSVNQLKRATLEFCGVKPVKITYFGVVKTASDELREKWLKKVELMGCKFK